MTKLFNIVKRGHDLLCYFLLFEYNVYQVSSPVHMGTIKHPNKEAKSHLGAHICSKFNTMVCYLFHIQSRSCLANHILLPIPNSTSPSVACKMLVCIFKCHWNKFQLSFLQYICIWLIFHSSLKYSNDTTNLPSPPPP